MKRTLIEKRNGTQQINITKAKTNNTHITQNIARNGKTYQRQRQQKQNNT